MADRIGNRGASANFIHAESALHISYITWQVKTGNSVFLILAATDNYIS
jgi:hypothetical protein